jgi:hypothetical protein
VSSQYVIYILLHHVLFNLRMDDNLKKKKKKKKNSGSRRGPGVNKVSFRARPHHNVHNTLGVDT